MVFLLHMDEFGVVFRVFFDFFEFVGFIGVVQVAVDRGGDQPAERGG